MKPAFRTGLRLAACCLALLAVAGPAGSTESAQHTAAELDRLRTYLAGMQDLRADFRQEVIGPDQQVVESASGTVVLSKPGRFRWDYREPYRRIIVADGKHVWFYESDLEQVTVRRMAAGLGDTPAALLTGDVAALEHFRPVDSWSSDDLHWLQLAPISAEADFSTVDLGFGTGELRQIEFVDRLGQRTRIFLSAIDRSPLPDDRMFHFKIPDGVDVIGTDDM